MYNVLYLYHCNRNINFYMICHLVSNNLVQIMNEDVAHTCVHVTDTAWRMWLTCRHRSRRDILTCWVRSSFEAKWAAHVALPHLPPHLINSKPELDTTSANNMYKNPSQSIHLYTCTCKSTIMCTHHFYSVQMTMPLVLTDNLPASMSLFFSLPPGCLWGQAMSRQLRSTHCGQVTVDNWASSLWR